MPILRNNAQSTAVAAEFEGVDVTFITVDFINTMVAETTDPQAAANTAGLALAREAIQNLGVNIIGEGALGNSNTEKTYMVRSDSLDTISTTTTVNAIQAAIRALNGNAKITATISSATAASRDMSATAVLA
jgi:hypothetical protein